MRVIFESCFSSQEPLVAIFDMKLFPTDYVGIDGHIARSKQKTSPFSAC